MASAFEHALPDWDAKLPPRGYDFTNYKFGEARGFAVSLVTDGDDLDRVLSDATGTGPFPPLDPTSLASGNETANRRIGYACVILTVLFVVMMVAQFMRIALAGGQ